MDGNVLLLLNLALAFYLIGTIWVIEIDIFRSWKLVDPKDFSTVQSVHWHKLPYWIFVPLVLALGGSIALIWVHPPHSPKMGDLGKFGSSDCVAFPHRNFLGQVAEGTQQR